MLPLVITVCGADGNPRRYAFAESPVSIGRSPFAELQLTEAFVSRWEGTVRFDERGVTYFILGSTNPTYVDGRPITEREQDLPIGVDSILQIGELELRFTREPATESDLRRRGKPRPVQEGEHTGAKTVYLDARQALPSPAQAAPATILPIRMPIRAHHAAPDDLATVIDLRLDHTVEEVTPDGSLPDSYRAYRASLRALVRQVGDVLTNAEEAQRPGLLSQLQRRYPEAFREPDLRTVLRRLGLPVATGDVPEVREWLKSIGQDILPPGLTIDGGLTLARVFRLLELLTQSLAELHSAQDSVRSRWLGRMPRRSVLHSDNGRLVLSYLLNPQANWEERVAELEQSVRDAITHELALFKAMLEASRTLVDALSPEAIAQTAEHEPVDDARAATPWWRRLRAPDPEVRLWKRFLDTHSSLVDGNRYQRTFLGRMFARSYLTAMGQSDSKDLS